MQTSHQNNRWRLSGKIQRFVGFAHHSFKLLADDFDELLTRSQRFGNLDPHRAFFNAIDEITNDRQRNVRL
ncbi:Uncharacterised protein [Vibrio cholerae]|nr:Uncharacterised protein [Vibrio cholerae]CSB84506.1 Uncharacterised protein [Vibrio cholerae]